MKRMPGKSFLVSLIVLLGVVVQCSYAAGEGRSKMIAPGVYAITDLGFSNCGFIVTDEGVVVVDTLLIPAFAEEMVKEIRAVTDKPVKYVINTHWHTDHVGGNETFLPQAHIISHTFTRKIIVQRRKEQEEGKVDESLKSLGKFTFVPPDITFDESLTLYLGGKEMELKFLGGGHTGGDIIVYLPKEKVLFSGDLLIKGSGMPDYRDDSNIDALIESLKRIQAFDIDKIICGHVGIAEKKEIQGSIDKLVAFRQQVKKYVEKNIPPEKAAEEIKFPEGENPFYEHNFKKVILKVYSDIKNPRR